MRVFKWDSWRQLRYRSHWATSFSTASKVGDVEDFVQHRRSMGTRAIVGMVMIIAGNMMIRVGRMGLAGAGFTLDPEEARRDVEPWARMVGGVAKDALDEAGFKMESQPSNDEQPLDERLRRLQKLLDDNLISEQEYESTKKKILESA